MDESRKDEMRQEPTNNLFLTAGGFGLLASLVASGLIVAAASF